MSFSGVWHGDDPFLYWKIAHTANSAAGSQHFADSVLSLLLKAGHRHSLFRPGWEKKQKAKLSVAITGYFCYFSFS